MPLKTPIEGGGRRAGLSDRPGPGTFGLIPPLIREYRLRGTMRAIRIHETGGPEVLKLEEVDLPKPGPGEVRFR